MAAHFVARRRKDVVTGFRRHDGGGLVQDEHRPYRYSPVQARKAAAGLAAVAGEVVDRGLDAAGFVGDAGDAEAHFHTAEGAHEL